MAHRILNRNKNWVGSQRWYLYLPLLINLLLCTTINAQQTVTVADYLLSIRESKQVKGNDYKLSFLREYNYRLPLIKGVQLRSETRDFLFDRQEYSMRINPSGFRAISKQKGLYQNRLEMATLENDLDFNTQLEKRYFQIVNYVATTEFIELIAERQKQLMDKSRILKESMYDINFDVTDLVDTEDQLKAIELKLKNLKEAQQKQQSEMKQIMNGLRDSIAFTFDDLIDPEQIIEKSKAEYSTTEPLKIRLQKLELNTMKSELDLSTAKSNQLLDFVQVKYEGDNEFVFQENISVGIGINLDFASNRQRKGDYYFDKLNEEIKLATLEEEVASSQKEEMFELKKAIENFMFTQNQIENGSIGPIYELYKNMQGAPPALLAKLKLLLNEKQLANTEAKHELYTRYIRTLSVQEILFQKPLRNYLSASVTYINPR